MSCTQLPSTIYVNIRWCGTSQVALQEVVPSPCPGLRVWEGEGPFGGGLNNRWRVACAGVNANGELDIYYCWNACLPGATCYSNCPASSWSYVSASINPFSAGPLMGAPPSSCNQSGQDCVDPFSFTITGDSICEPPRKRFCQKCGSDNKNSGNLPVYSSPGIRYFNGEVALEETDLQTSGFGMPWGHTRRFASKLSIHQTVGNGFNWQPAQWPYVIIPNDDSAVVQLDTCGPVWFSAVNGGYEPWFGEKFSFSFDQSAGVYRLVDGEGTVTEFDADTGMFQKRTDAAGNTIQVTALHATGYNLSQVERSYTTGGNTITEQFLYDYASPTGDAQLTAVTLRRRENAGSWTNVARATYGYYAPGDSYGSDGDLKTATRQVWSNGQWQSTGTSLYRYYLTLQGTSSSSSSSSAASGDIPEPTYAASLLKYVVNPASYDRLAVDPGVSDPATASNAMIAQYADRYFEYDSQQRVTRVATDGGSRVYEYTYSESGFSDDYNHWKYKTVETLPGGEQRIVYNNFAGYPVLETDRADSQQWCTFYKYDSQCQVVLKANPSAVSGFDEQYADLLHQASGNYEFLRDGDGLVRTYSYHLASGFLASESIQKGELGTPIKLREYEYVPCGTTCGSSSSSSCSSSQSGVGKYLVSRETLYPSDSNQAKTLVTSYCYTYHPGTCAVQQRTTTLPAVPTDQNGSGVAATRREYFDPYGNLIWAMDERGFIIRRKNDIVTGAQSQQIEDVDTTIVSDAPSGWTTPTGGGLHLVTDFEYDSLGRTTQVLGPAHSVDLGGVATTVRRASWMVYQDASHELWSGQGYATGSSPSYSYSLVNPVSITKQDAAGKVLEQIQAVRSSTVGKLQNSDTFPQSAYVRWTTNQYTDCCLMASQRVYHTIPSSGTGLEGTNFDESDYGYDARKRQNRSVTPGGTIHWTVFDGLGRAIKRYVGTNDTGATESDPTGGGASGNNMVLVTEMQYDGGGVGDGNLTQLKQWVDGSTSRVTAYSYDWRNRRTETDGEIDFFEKTYFDNLDRRTKGERYNTTSSDNLADRSETKYDDRGRVYQTVRWGVDESTGTVGNSLTDNTWYDESGNVIKSLPSGSKRFTKFVYDGLGRRTRQYQGYDLDETAYSEAFSVSDDTIFEQTEFTYDAAGNVIQITQRQRYHNATGTGELTTPSGSQPKSRVTHVASWPDALGRQQASAEFGTYQGNTFARPSTIPSRSDTILVNSLTYNSAGQVVSQTNPGGVTTCLEYDAAGRQTKTVMNCVTGSSSSGLSSSSSSSITGPGCLPSDEVNVTVLTAYNADGNVSSITAVNAMTGNQITQYVYGSTLADSGIASSLLKVAEIYPDSEDADDRITFKYNRQGEVIETRDQNGTVHAYDYDALGRQTQDRVTTLGTGVDGAVRRIGTTYTVRGAKSKITSYDNATAGSGSIVNEVLFTYNAFGQIEKDYQSHSGAVNTSTTPKVQMTYADGSSNHVRQTGLIYPNAREVHYDYGASGSTADALSRVASIIDDDGTTHLADYTYLGLNAFVEVDYTEPDIKYTLVGTAGGNDLDTGDIYRGLDRFGRVKDSYWYNYGTLTDVDRIRYGYDRNDNRIYLNNFVAATKGTFLDEIHCYDSIGRLTQMDRGQLALSKDSIISKTFSQCWALDATGNWRKFQQDSTGDGTWDLDQTRSVNKANESIAISEYAGPLWITPTYDRSGNMTTIPRPANPTQTFMATYDAWDRLVRLVDLDDAIADYVYDGLWRRIVLVTHANGLPSEERHLYYTDLSRWQVVEERLGASPDEAVGERQFVWGERYIDDIVLRDLLDPTGALEERIYAMQDVGWSTNAITDLTGEVKERFSYGAYGESAVMTPDFAEDADRHIWENRYAGYRYDIRSSFHYARIRYLSSKLGQWLSRDPLYHGGPFAYYMETQLSTHAAPRHSLSHVDYLFKKLRIAPSAIDTSDRYDANLLQYSGGNPVGNTDPFGLCPGMVKITSLTHCTRCCCPTNKPNVNYKPVVNGCTLVPNLSFKSCCNAHDMCYQKCGNNKNACDVIFLGCMLTSCNRVTWGTRTACRAAAYNYYLGVERAGSPWFDESQRKACLWVPKRCPTMYMYRGREDNYNISPPAADEYPGCYTRRWQSTLGLY